MPLDLELPFLKTELKIHVGSMEELDLEARPKLSPADEARLEAVTNSARQNTFTNARKALNHILPETLLSQLEYEGKQPVLPAGHLSISHSNTAAAAIYSPHLKVGIDIESSVRNLGRIGHKFLREDEQFILDRFGNDIGLHFVWGIKESLYKLYGKGGLDFKDHLQITTLETHSEPWAVGVAWIFPKDTPPLQAFIQASHQEGTTLCIASHRSPMEPIQSDRLYLREWTPDDAHWLYELNADPQVTYYTSDTGFSSPAAALDLILTYANYQRDGYGRWMVMDASTDEPLGWCGLKKNPWGIDLGFRYYRKLWNKGYATEAANATIAWAKKHHLGELIGRALSGNVASIRVLEKLGFTEEDRVPIEVFSTDHPLSEEEQTRLDGQLVVMHKLTLEP